MKANREANRGREGVREGEAVGHINCILLLVIAFFCFIALLVGNVLLVLGHTIQ